MTTTAKVVLTGVLAALLGAQAWAATSISSCQTHITVPGNYVVTADLTCADNGIMIEASNVSLTLNGHIITNTGRVAAGVYLFPPTGTRLNHVGISGPGLIRNFGKGIIIWNSDYVQVSQVTVANNANAGVHAIGVNQLTVLNNVMAQNGGSGLALHDTSNATATGNQLIGTVGSSDPLSVGDGSAIWLASGSSNMFNGNTASGNAGNGIRIGYSGTPATANGGRIASNTTIGNAKPGIRMHTSGSGFLIFSNTSSVGNSGFDLADDNPVCGTNLWSDNVFFTRNMPCVK